MIIIIAFGSSIAERLQKRLKRFQVTKSHKGIHRDQSDDQVFVSTQYELYICIKHFGELDYSCEMTETSSGRYCTE